MPGKPWPIGTSRAVVFNTEAAYLFIIDDEYRANAEKATQIFCDGFGLQIYALLRFGKLLSRRHGPDIFHDYLLERSGARVHFVGGSPRCHEALRVKYADFFVHNQVTINTDRLSDEDDFKRAARTIAGAGHDDVLIFLGLARQEKLQRMLFDAGFAGSSIGLGAAIDFISGSKKRAGTLWQWLGLEWFPRLIREPRMLPRVLRSFSIFLLWFHYGNARLASYLRR